MWHSPVLGLTRYLRPSGLELTFPNSDAEERQTCRNDGQQAAYTTLHIISALSERGWEKGSKSPKMRREQRRRRRKKGGVETKEEG